MPSVQDLSKIAWDNIHFAHPDHNFYGGVIAFVAAIFSNLGVNTQRHSHIRDAHLAPERQVAYIYRPLWWLGFAGVLIGAVADFVAVGIASQPLVAAIGGGTTLIANIFFAHYWNGDKLYPTDGLGVFFIIAGCVVFAFTSERSKTYTEAELVEKFGRESFLMYLSAQIIIMCLLLATIATSEVFRWRVQATEKLFSPMLRRMARLEKKRQLHIQRLRERVAVLEVALAKKLGRDEAEEEQPRRYERMPMVESAELHSDQDHWLDQYIYGACSGVVGAMSLLFAGLTSKLLMRLFRGHYSEYRKPLPYVIIGSLLMTLVLQTALLNAAMQRGDTMSIYPVFQAFWITFGVIGGVVFYQIGAVDLTGMSLMVIGTFFLVQHNQFVEDHEDGSAGSSHGHGHGHGSAPRQGGDGVEGGKVLSPGARHAQDSGAMVVPDAASPRTRPKPKRPSLIVRHEGEV